MAKEPMPKKASVKYTNRNIIEGRVRTSAAALKPKPNIAKKIATKPVAKKTTGNIAKKVVATSPKKASQMKAGSTKIGPGLRSKKTIPTPMSERVKQGNENQREWFNGVRGTVSTDAAGQLQKVSRNTRYDKIGKGQYVDRAYSQRAGGKSDVYGEIVNRRKSKKK